METTAGKKRFDLGTFKLAALAIGIAGIVAAGAAAVAISRDETAPAATTETRSIGVIDPGAAVRLEQEMLRNELAGPGGDASVTGSTGERLAPQSSYVDDSGDVPFNPGGAAAQAQRSAVSYGGASRWRHADSRGESYLRFPELHASTLDDATR
jgi:hypothetical protein